MELFFPPCYHKHIGKAIVWTPFIITQLFLPDAISSYQIRILHSANQNLYGGIIIKGTTHIAGGIVAAELLMISMLPDTAGQYLTVISGAVLGSILPDIDAGQSKISNKNWNTKIAGFALENILGHRKIIHTPFTAALITLFLYYIVPFAFKDSISMSADAFRLFSLALGAGFLSHLVLDSLNPAGIMWFAPFKKRRYRFGRIQPYSLGEWIVFAVLMILAAFLATNVLHIPIQDIFKKYSLVPRQN